jgi:hypothetical protein
MVGLVGLEPTTSCSQSTRATKLRHSPIRHQGTSQPFLVTDDSYVGLMELEVAVLERVRAYKSLSRWERSELGKDLRRQGLSYGEIMDLIPVKKSTLATWCRDVDLTTKQIEAIRERRAQEPGIPRDTQRKRRREIELIRAQAALEAHHLVTDPLWTTGVALYWGEGSKATRQLSMANSDPALLRTFISWSIRFLPPDTGWRAKLNVHANNDENQARIWWSRELGIDLSNFTKSFLKPEGTGHRKNHLPHGVCMVTKRRSTDDYHRSMAWIDFMKNEAGR